MALLAGGRLPVFYAAPSCCCSSRPPPRRTLAHTVLFGVRGGATPLRRGPVLRLCRGFPLLGGSRAGTIPWSGLPSPRPSGRHASVLRGFTCRPSTVQRICIASRRRRTQSPSCAGLHSASASFPNWTSCTCSWGMSSSGPSACRRPSGSRSST